MGSIKSKLEYLNQTKHEIRDAIISRGVTVSSDDTFRSYSAKIRSIETHDSLMVEPYSITQNGEYEAPEGKGYNPVTVNVSGNVKSKTITEPGEYKAKDDDCEGYDKVTVSLSTHLKSITVDKSKIGELPEKKTFKAKEDSDEGTLGYTEVTVDFSNMLEDKSIDVDESHFGEENTYVASEESPSVYGYGSFTIRIVEQSGPFTVKYYSNGSLLYEEQVAKGGNGYYIGDPPSANGKIFVGWDPEPVDVQRNMSCYAVFEDEFETVDGDGNVNESWDQIARNKGAALPMGSHATLYGGAISYDGCTLSPGWSAQCYKVGDRVDPGTTTTWMFKLPIAGRVCTQSKKNSEGGPTQLISSFNGWDGCSLQGFLNGSLKTSLSSRTDKKYGNAAAIVSAIRSVTKESYLKIIERGTIPSIDDTVFEDNISTTDTFFIPSYSECNSDGARYYEKTNNRYTGVSSQFYRTCIFTKFYNGPSDEKGGSYQPYPNLPKHLLCHEGGSFVTPGNGWSLIGYMYVNEDFNREWKGTGTKDYWDETQPPRFTQVFTELTICFCL